jgi:Leucine-rich repeat (LRR) protein
MKHLKQFKMFEVIINNTMLTVASYGLTSLPELPEDLEILYCYENKLTSLPELPKTLKILMCHDNQIKLLPELPEKLEVLYCYNNPLESLIPTKFIRKQDRRWLNDYYYPYIMSYEGQKKILNDDPNNLKILKRQTAIHPDIKKEYRHLFTGTDLNLL